jgi:hypothetical protein
MAERISGNSRYALEGLKLSGGVGGGDEGAKFGVILFPGG